MFSQQAVAGQQGFSDFTHPNTAITVAGQPFDHLLYQFRLAFSGWRSVLVTRGGESYSALADGLQRAMRQKSGGSRFTDHDLRAKVASDSESLSAAQTRLGHQSAQLTNRVYTRKPAQVSVLERPLKEK